LKAIVQRQAESLCDIWLRGSQAHRKAVGVWRGLPRGQEINMTGHVRLNELE
jgi:hypothetical protein